MYRGFRFRQTAPLVLTALLLLPAAATAVSASTRSTDPTAVVQAQPQDPGWDVVRPTAQQI
ncbi:hypothetical protein [Streptacidiphilus monticola]|uniref:Uncharacterized protein n=1 Tax=Streptacidiphilus monticola TaxID=2161674 RepID=A0ABW1GBF5_9ACTN